MNISNNSKNYDSAQAVIGFLVVGLMAVVFLIFYQNYEYLTQPGQLYNFMILATIAAGLLIGLFYLVGKPAQKHKTVAHKTHKKKRSSR